MSSARIGNWRGVASESVRNNSRSAFDSTKATILKTSKQVVDTNNEAVQKIVRKELREIKSRMVITMPKKEAATQLNKARLKCEVETCRADLTGILFNQVVCIGTRKKFDPDDEEKIVAISSRLRELRMLAGKINKAELPKIKGLIDLSRSTLERCRGKDATDADGFGSKCIR